MFDLVAIGDVVWDIILESEKISLLCPRDKRIGSTCTEKVLCLSYGDKIPIRHSFQVVGGSATNVVVGLSRLGAETSLCGEVGGDEEGEKIIQTLEKENVDLTYLKKYKKTKSSFSIVIIHKGEKTILFYRGFRDYSKMVLPKSLKTKWLFLSSLGPGYEKIYRNAISLAAEKNIQLAINPGNLQIEEKKPLQEILRVTKTVFFNRKEASSFCGRKNTTPVKELMVEIKKHGPEIVVITDGPDGAYAFDGKTSYHIGTYIAKRKEATGAGDAFTSGFLSAILLGKDVKKALQYGVINSASVIEHIGAQQGLLSGSQIESRLPKAPIPKEL